MITIPARRSTTLPGVPPPTPPDAAAKTLIGPAACKACPDGEC
jgi:hypothetical protein